MVNHRRTISGAGGAAAPCHYFFAQMLNFRAETSSQKWKNIFFCIY